MEIGVIGEVTNNVTVIESNTDVTAIESNVGVTVIESNIADGNIVKGNIEGNVKVDNVECGNSSTVILVPVVTKTMESLMCKITSKMIDIHCKTCDICEQRRYFMETLYKLDMYKNVDAHLNDIDGRDKLCDELYDECKKCFITTNNLL